MKAALADKRPSIRLLLGPADIDVTVQRRLHLGERGSHVIRGDRLERGSGQMHDIALDAGLRDAFDEFEAVGQIGPAIRPFSTINTRRNTLRYCALRASFRQSDVGAEPLHGGTDDGF